MPERDEARSLPSSTVVMLVIFGLVILLTVVGALLPEKPKSQRIMEGCQREFASEGQERVNECSIKLMAQELEKIEADKLRRAGQ